MHLERSAWRGLQRDQVEASITLKSSAGIHESVAKRTRGHPAGRFRKVRVRMFHDRSAHFHITLPASFPLNPGAAGCFLMLSRWRRRGTFFRRVIRRVQPPRHVAMWAAVHDAALAGVSSLSPGFAPNRGRILTNTDWACRSSLRHLLVQIGMKMDTEER